MIARLHGKVAALEEEAVIVDVGGVGFRVRVPARLLAELGPEGSTVTLHTYLYVRDDALELFGALEPETLRLFELLLTVSGIGPRLALAVISTFDGAVLRQAILEEDVPLLTEVSGVGRKTAKRIILDLQGRLEQLGFAAAPTTGGGPTPSNDAVAALNALGYSSGEARRALAGADVDPDSPVEEQIKAALRALST